MNRILFTGSGVALATPFTKDAGAIDYETYGRMIDWHIDQGTDALIAFGTTGEPSTIRPEEKFEGIRFVVERAAGRVPVIAGSGGNDTTRTIEQARTITGMGVDGLLVVTPYYNKTTQAGLVRHYSMIADMVDIPMIMYNVPSRTGLNMLPETALQLCEHPNICGIKEASADIVQITETARLVEDKIALYSGNDDHVLPLMSLGAKGVISVVANVTPRSMHELVSAYLRGDIDTARRIQFTLNPLIKQLFSEVNPIPLKTALKLMGFGSGALRMPLVDMSPAGAKRLEEAMRHLSLL